MSGSSLSDESNLNYSQLDVPALTRRIDAAARLTGRRRYRTYGQLDVEIMRKYAPLVPFAVRNEREFLSARVGCYAPVGPYGFLDLAAVCIQR